MHEKRKKEGEDKLKKGKKKIIIRIIISIKTKNNKNELFIERKITEAG